MPAAAYCRPARDGPLALFPIVPSLRKRRGRHGPSCRRRRACTRVSTKIGTNSRRRAAAYVANSASTAVLISAGQRRRRAEPAATARRSRRVVSTIRRRRRSRRVLRGCRFRCSQLPMSASSNVPLDRAATSPCGSTVDLADIERCSRDRGYRDSRPAAPAVSSPNSLTSDDAFPDVAADSADRGDRRTR